MLKRLVDFDVVFCFVVAVKLGLFEITDRLSTCLQAKAMTAGRGVHLVNEAVAELQHFRTEAAFVSFWDEALKMKENIAGDEPKLPRQSRARASRLCHSPRFLSMQIF